MDGLKGLGAIPIMLYHYYSNFCGKDVSLVPIPPAALFKNGFLSVELFFAISGYLSARACRDSGAEISFKTYISPKLCRVMPCYFLSNLIIFVNAIINKCFIGSPLTVSPSLWGFIVSCTPFYSGWISTGSPYSAIGWFISVLFLCYTLYYLALQARKNNEHFYFVICILMVLIGCNGYQLDSKIPFLYSQASRGYISFFTGVLLYHIFDLNFNKKFLSALGLVLLGVSAVLGLKFGNVLGPAVFSVNFIAVPVVLLTVTTWKGVQKFLETFPLLYLGRMSMSLYLIHHPVIQVIKLVNYVRGGVNPSSIKVFLFITAAEVTASVLEYEVFEKRIFPKLIPHVLSFIGKAA